MKKNLPGIIIFISFSLSALSITPSVWDIGSISSNSGQQALEIIVYNDTSKEIKIDFISTCDCFWSDTDKLILSPDESGQALFFLYDEIHSIYLDNIN